MNDILAISVEIWFFCAVESDRYYSPGYYELKLLDGKNGTLAQRSIRKAAGVS